MKTKNIKIVADNKIPFLKGVLEPYADIRYLPGKDITSGDVKNADALIIRTRTKCDEYLLAASHVRFIASATIGYDHIDTSYCKKSNIKWTNAPGCNASSVAQYICAALLTLAEKYKFSLQDKTIGIIGVGNVGKKIENISKILGLKIILNDPPRAEKEGNKLFCELDKLLAESDIVTCHVPLNRHGKYKTLHMADKEFFRKLKRGAIFINSSRGEVVDTTALKQAIKANMLKAVVLDVWENEPDIDIELLRYVDIATPHIAGYSLDGKANGTSMSVRALSKFFNLPLTNWFPSHLPEPDNKEYILKDITDSENIYSLLLHIVNLSYPIMRDDEALRQHPERFEKLRGDYPLRREFPVFTIKTPVKKISKNSRLFTLLNILTSLGFKINSISS